MKFGVHTLNSARGGAGLPIRFTRITRRRNDRILPRSRFAVNLKGIPTGRSILGMKIQNRLASMIAFCSDIISMRRLFFAGIAPEILRCMESVVTYHFLPVVLNLRVPLSGARINASVPAREDV